MSKYANLKSMVKELARQINKKIGDQEWEENLHKALAVWEAAITAETILECAEEKDRGRSLAKLFSDRIALAMDTLAEFEAEEISTGPAGEMMKAVCNIMDEIEKEAIERELEAQRKKIKIPTLDGYAREAKKII